MKPYATTHQFELRMRRRPVLQSEARDALLCGYRFPAYVVIDLIRKIKRLEGRS